MQCKTSNNACHVKLKANLNKIQKILLIKSKLHFAEAKSANTVMPTWKLRH